MIGVDSNLILRWLLNDDPGQADRTERILRAGETVHVAHIVLVETAWVLASAYRQPRAAISRALREVIGMPDVDIADREVILDALTAYEAGGPGLADHMIGHLNRHAGCRTTLTFDKKAADGALFTHVT